MNNSLSANSSSQSTIARNTLFLYIRMILVMLVSLYTSRIVLNELGISDYGIYSVVGGFVALFGILNASLSSATQRYLSLHIGRGDIEALAKTFSATMTIHIALALIIFFLSETIGLWYVNNKMVFPESRIFAVNVIFQLSVFSILIGVIQVPYNALIIAHEKMKIFATIGFVEVFLKLAIIFILVISNADKLVLYASLSFVSALGIRLFYQWFCRKNYRESKYSFFIDRSYFIELLSYSGWSVFGNAAATAREQGNNVIINLFSGTVVNGAFGIAMVVQNSIVSFVHNYQVAFNPQIVKHFSRNEIGEMEKLVNQSAKFSFYMLLILIVPILLNTDYILTLWLKNVPQHAVVFVMYCLVFLLIDIISHSYIFAVQATGKIKYFQLTVGTLIMLNLPITYLFLIRGEDPSIVYKVMIILSVITLFVILYFTKKVIGFNNANSFRQVIIPIAVVTGILFTVYFLINQMGNIDLRADSIFQLLGISAGSLIATLIIVFCFGLQKSEKNFVIRIINEKYLSVFSK